MRHRTRDGSPGASRLGILLTLAILAGAGFVGSKIVPPYWNYLAMHEHVKEAAMAAASRRDREAQARAELIARAKSLGVALDEENVDINQEGNLVMVRVHWSVPLDFRVYRTTLRFDVEKGAPAP
jgi:hypothetical protein